MRNTANVKSSLIRPFTLLVLRNWQWFGKIAVFCKCCRHSSSCNIVFFQCNFFSIHNATDCCKVALFGLFLFPLLSQWSSEQIYNIVIFSVLRVVCAAQVVSGSNSYGTVHSFIVSVTINPSWKAEDETLKSTSRYKILASITVGVFYTSKHFYQN